MSEFWTIVLFIGTIILLILHKPKEEEKYIEIAQIRPLPDPRIDEAIQALRSYGYNLKDSKKYVQIAYEKGYDDLISGALAEIEV